jgi:ATP-dependent Clp protease ATP-binding subunit ClpA
MKISEQLETALTRAGYLAIQYHNEFVTPEHLLFAMSESQDGNDIISACGGNVLRLQAALNDFFVGECPTVSPGTPPDYSAGLQDVIAISAQHSLSSEHAELKIGNVMVGLFRLKDSDAVYFLNQQSIDRLAVVEYLSHGIKKEGPATVTSEPQATPSAHSDLLINLCQKARDGKFDPLIGRADALEQLIQVLARRRKNNPIFVGDAGVGKTAIVEGLASAIVAGNVPDSLKNMNIFSLDLGSLMAGTRYRGDFEEKFKKVLADLKKNPNAALFIDEIHMIVGAGAVSGGAIDIANLLKPLLTGGELRCIGTTTHKEYRQTIEKDAALARRFQKIDILPPSVEDTIAILNGLAPKFSEFHGVTYTPDAISGCATLTEQYITDRAQPDKAIDALDHAGAVAKLAHQATVALTDIEIVVSKMAKVPPKTVQTDEKEKIQHLESTLKSVIVGQDAAISTLCTAIMISKAGLGNPDRPIGSFLCIGPTGVGKTELAKQLAASLGIELLRFDMSEYMEKHTVSRLIGSPPGYVGHDDGGQLSEAVRRAPHSLVLLDEIEKAHPDILNILLQLMDYGTLTDSLGRKIDFRNTILMMTSNTGARDRMNKPIGFEKPAHGTSKIAIDRDFSPEFRNRLSAIIEFESLTPTQVIPIAEAQLNRIKTQLAGQKIGLEWTPDVVSWITENGFDPILGARPLNRFIEESIVHPISRAIIDSRCTLGQTVHIRLVKNKLEFLFHSIR